MATDVETAYAAGILDGEGSICLCRHNDGYHRWPVLEVAISSTDYELLAWFKDRWGGRIVAKKRYKEHHKQSWMLHFKFQQAVKLLELLSPYLVIERKRKRAQVGIQYGKAASRNGRYTEEQEQRRKSLLDSFV